MDRYYGMYADQRRPTSTNPSIPIKEEPGGILQQPFQPPSMHKDRDKEKDKSEYSQSKNAKTPSQSSAQQTHKSSAKDIKTEDKEMPRVIKQEGQKPTMETQGPPPPPTSQYFIHPSYMSPGPFGFDPASHPLYRNMMVPSAYGASPYHLQMSRFHAPEDLSRNPNPKALDILQHHANQYYNPHKIHELSERALKSPTGTAKTAVSSPNVTQTPPTQHSSNSGATSSASHSSLGSSNTGSINLTHQTPVALPSSSGVGKSNTASTDKMNIINEMPGGIIKDGPPTGRSPPPQRHVHTHHHTHVGVGLGYPMYPAAYGGKNLFVCQSILVVSNLNSLISHGNAKNAYIRMPIRNI